MPVPTGPEPTDQRQGWVPDRPRRRPRPYPPGVEPGSAAAAELAAHEDVAYEDVAAEDAGAEDAAEDAGYPAEPVRPNGSRAALLAGGAVLVVAAIAVAVVLLVAGGRNAGHGSGDAGTRAGPPPGTSPLGSGGPTPAAGSVDDAAARRVVLSYLDDVNARDEAAAGRLICAERYAAWKRNAAGANGDLAFTVVRSTFQRAQRDPAGGGLVLTYSLAFDDSTSNVVAFTVVQQHGLKICGIASR